MAWRNVLVIWLSDEKGKIRGKIAPTDATVSNTPRNSIVTERENALLYAVLKRSI
jgi:hypothetical protein